MFEIKRRRYKADGVYYHFRFSAINFTISMVAVHLIIGRIIIQSSHGKSGIIISKRCHADAARGTDAAEGL